MRQVHSRLKRRFLIHGVLVLLPLVLLTVLAVSWLRQDQYMVKESAQEVAKLSTKESVRRIQERITTLTGKGASNALPSLLEFKLTEEGQLLSPAPRDLLPVPKVYPVEQLPEREKALWLKAMAVESGGTVEVRSKAWGAFLAGAATEEWRALGQYHLALALAEEKPQEASSLLQEIFTKPLTVSLESGLPLLPLAEWRWMELNSNLVTSEVIEHFSSNVVTQASFLTPTLLTQTICRVGKPNADWLGKWYRDETIRRLHVLGAALWSGHGDRDLPPVWLELEWDKWYLINRRQGGVVTGISWKDAWAVAREELRASIPESRTTVYEVKVAGKVLIDAFLDTDISVRHQVVVPAEAEVLAVATGEDGNQTVEVTAFLWKNTLYQAKQDQRLWSFGAVIALAVWAALVGVVSAWRTFQQQEQLSEMKGNFVSSVSHELRAPLASVRLMAESLERGKVTEDEKRQEYYQLIGRECRRLTALIENVLDFARMNQGRKQYHVEPTDLGALVRHTVKSMEPYAGERGVTLALSIQGVMQDALLDGQAMQQALVNLIDNAVKYSPAGGSVRVKMECRPEQLELAVTDDGPGIPMEEQEKIFERFYRRGSELRRETQGVGIGLSIVKHVVEAHGGKVVVESSLGRGSTFRLIIPQTKA